MNSLRLMSLGLLLALSANTFARQPVFFSLHAGGEEHDVDYQFPTEIAFDPADDGETLGLGVGYEINDRWNLMLDYTVTDADEVDIDQILLSLNYRLALPQKGLSAVMGVVAGEGKLDWNDQPSFSDSRFDDLSTRQSLYGVQFGFNYDLAEHWSTGLMYQYFEQKLKTNLATDFGRLDVEHKNPQYLLFSLRYHL